MPATVPNNNKIITWPGSTDITLLVLHFYMWKRPRLPRPGSNSPVGLLPSACARGLA